MMQPSHNFASSQHVRVGFGADGMLPLQAAAQQTAAILEVARTEAEDLQACLQHEQVHLSS